MLSDINRLKLKHFRKTVTTEHVVYGAPPCIYVHISKYLFFLYVLKNHHNQLVKFTYAQLCPIIYLNPTSLCYEAINFINIFFTEICNRLVHWSQSPPQIFWHGRRSTQHQQRFHLFSVGMAIMQETSWKSEKISNHRYIRSNIRSDTSFPA